jgi:hypothetical protein
LVAAALSPSCSSRKPNAKQSFLAIAAGPRLAARR